MRKTGYFLTLVSLFIFPLALGTTTYAFECVGDDGFNCLQCHTEPDIMFFHVPSITSDCTACHCGEYETSPCDWGGLGFEPVETFCCISCHDQCQEVNAHTNRVENDYDCGQCHFPPGTPGNCVATVIPTLTEWGIIIFMTVIMGIGVVILDRRRID